MRARFLWFSFTLFFALAIADVGVQGQVMK